MKRIYKINKGEEIPQKGGSKQCNKKLFPDLPSIVDVDKSLIDRIIAVGDIHGDLDLAIKCLEIPNLIRRVYEENDMTVSLWYKDEEVKRIYEWIGSRTIVVQVGDQIDRCRPYHKNCKSVDATVNDEASDLTIMFFYTDLHIVALKVGCAVYSLLGNHELLNVLGNMQYVSYKGLKEFPTTSSNIEKGRIEAFSLESNIKMYKKSVSLVEFLGCGRLSSIIVDGYLFVHAGVMETLINYIEKNKSEKNIVHTINDAVKSWLLSTYKDEEKKFVEALISGKNLSPFWPRVFGSLETNLDKDSKKCKKLVEPILEALSIKGLVVGHTPQLKININSTCSNTVWRVDVASSQAFDEVIYSGIKESEKDEINKGRVPQVLEIVLSKNPISNNKNNLDKFNVLT